MKKYVNGEYIDMTAEEIDAFWAERETLPETEQLSAEEALQIIMGVLE